MEPSTFPSVIAPGPRMPQGNAVIHPFVARFAAIIDTVLQIPNLAGPA